MATVSRTYMTDDIDGSGVDVTTIQIALDKVNYEIDLSAANQARLREILARFVDVATPVKPQTAARQGRKSAAAPGARSDKEQTVALRRWARENGYQLSNRGRIPKNVQQAFDEAH